MQIPEEVIQWVGPEEEGGCREWLGLFASNWTPVIRRGTKMITAKRLMYEKIHNVKLPPNMYVYSICNFKLCCNPEHFVLKNRGYDVDFQKAIELRESGKSWEFIANQVGWKGFSTNLARKIRRMLLRGQLRTKMRVWK